MKKFMTVKKSITENKMMTGEKTITENKMYSELFRNYDKNFELKEEREFACKKCVLPSDSITGEVKDGVCPTCGKFHKAEFLGQEQFIKDVDLADGEMLGLTVSGGKDSIYMWKKVVEIFGKDRVIAFNHRKIGLESEVAHENLENAKKILGAKLIYIEDQEMVERFARNFRLFIKNPKPESARVLMCAGCRNGITGKLYKEGEKYNITKFISGASYLELAPFKEKMLENKKIEDVIKVYKGISKSDKEVMCLDDKLKYKCNNGGESSVSKYYTNIKKFDFDKYFENNPQAYEKEVTETMKWKREEKSWHFDCCVEEFKDIFYYGYLGYTEADFKLSAMVRYGLLTREEAMEQVRFNDYMIQNSFEKVVERLIRMGLEDTICDLAKYFNSSKYLNNVDELLVNRYRKIV